MARWRRMRDCQWNYGPVVSPACSNSRFRSRHTLAATRTVEAELAFALPGFDCDNGSEFLNHHLHH